MKYDTERRYKNQTAVLRTDGNTKSEINNQDKQFLIVQSVASLMTLNVEVSNHRMKSYWPTMAASIRDAQPLTVAMIIGYQL